MTQQRQETIPASDHWRRGAVAGLAILLLIAGVVMRLTTEESSGHWNFGSGTLLRLSIAFGALWLAWPSLRRPAAWLPPGMVIVVLIGIAVVAVQPKMLPAVLPAVGLLFTVSVLVRMFR